MKMKISKHMQKKCRKFAEDRIGLSEELYRKRGEANVDKMLDDITIGAMAEWAVYKHLKEKGVECSKPDFEIYDAKKKAFSADLITTNHAVHVKSQSLLSANKYGSSWLFQKTDKLLSKPSDQDVMVFCIVDGEEVEIKALVSVVDVVDNDLTSEPKVWKYRFTKHAIYLDEVLDSQINLEVL